AHCNSALGKITHELYRLQTQILKHIALNNGKKHLSVVGVCFCAPFQPSVSAVHCPFGVLFVASVGGTFVKSHYYVGAEVVLDLHYLFGGENMSASVDV